MRKTAIAKEQAKWREIESDAKRLIELLGVRCIFNLIGMNVFLQALGVSRILEAIGVETFVSQLTPKQRRELLHTLEQTD